MAGREHVAYRLRVRSGEADYLVEQQAYYTTGDDGRIGWMRVLCSGYMPVPLPWSPDESPISPWLAANRLASARLAVPVFA